MKFGVITLGCKVNSYESEAVINDLINRGWEYSTLDKDLDVAVVNTCTVTSTSDQKSRQMLHLVRRNNPSAVIVAMGCFVQLHVESALNIADIVIGTNDKLKVYEKVMEFINTKEQINAITDVLNNPSYEEMKVSSMYTHTRAFIKIQDGCENYCSYCAIPFARGKIRSRNPEEVIKEINNLVLSGVKEVVLAGINTGTYGQDLGNINLAKLIERIMMETSILRIRLSSIELKEISDELLNTLVKYSSRVASHLHIPLQGGSDTVLKRMNRKYNTAEYYKRICDIRSALGDVALTTDVLAGFVGETEAEFKELLNFIDKVGFFEMHVFPYSRRTGTKADQMEGHLDQSIKKERAHIISEHAHQMRDNYIKKYLGKELEVLVETMHNGMYHGHTSNYLDVYFNSTKDLTNQIVKVKLVKYDNNLIIGELC